MAADTAYFLLQTEIIQKWQYFTVILVSLFVAVVGEWQFLASGSHHSTRPGIESKSPHENVAYRPVILVHGVFAVNNSLAGLRQFITQAHPGTSVTSIPLFENLQSVEPLWKQVPKFAAAMRPIMQQAQDGVILICYSQGGIICRGILETMSDHNVHTFIALSSPQMGQYGDTSYIPFLPKLKADVYKFCYHALGQHVSICNYWNDPHHQSLYQKGNDYLPVLNNETLSTNSQEWKANFLRLKQMVMIGGPNDGVITPWQSSHFGFYDNNENIVEMRDQEIYKYDSFGLRTLDKRNALKTYNVSGVMHTNWHRNQTVFDSCIEPWLS
ncbi:lysosomal thioesterase PPT2-A-like isoform X1 [Asterias amurensis]|uniref:lysosomal thioesterase PPT2-A-like isoform X1 n=1 Tax=Asterias amurensis TaxID=7602 RepID=UPI003AB1CA5D